MATKVFYVTTYQPVSKKRRVSRVIGFVSTFGWESDTRAPEKAEAKYPGYDNYSIHEATKTRFLIKKG